MENIKKSFENVKKDISEIFSIISNLREEINLLKNTINALSLELIKFRAQQRVLKESIGNIETDIINIKKSIDELKNLQKFGQVLEFSNTNPTHFQHKSNTFPTHEKKDLKFLRNKAYFESSTGNEGVPTLLRHSYVTPTSHLTELFNNEFNEETVKSKEYDNKESNKEKDKEKDKEQSLLEITQEKARKEVETINNTLTRYKSEIMKRFKKLTRKEFEIFSLIYTMQETQKVTYKVLAEKTGLAPSSVRDLVNRIILKGIPIDKVRSINREVFLRIPDEIKKISSLDAIEKIVNFYNFRYNE